MKSLSKNIYTLRSYCGRQVSAHDDDKRQAASCLLFLCGMFLLPFCRKIDFFWLHSHEYIMGRRQSPTQYPIQLHKKYSSYHRHILIEHKNRNTCTPQCNSVEQPCNKYWLCKKLKKYNVQFLILWLRGFDSTLWQFLRFSLFWWINI